MAPLLARQRDVTHQPLREGLRGFVVAGRVFDLLVVVAELDQQHVAARSDLSTGASQPSSMKLRELRPDCAWLRTSPRGGIEEGLQLHAPALARRALGAVLAGGGIADDEHAMWRSRSGPMPTGSSRAAKISNRIRMAYLARGAGIRTESGTGRVQAPGEASASRPALSRVRALQRASQPPSTGRMAPCT